MVPRPVREPHRTPAREPGRPGDAGVEVAADDRGAAPAHRQLAPAQPGVPAPGPPVQTVRPGSSHPRPAVADPSQRTRTRIHQPPPRHGLRASRPRVQHPAREPIQGPGRRLPTPRPRMQQHRAWMDPGSRPLRNAVVVEEAGVEEAAGALVLPTAALRGRPVPTRRAQEAPMPPAIWWIARHRRADTAATGRPLQRRPATGNPGDRRSTSEPTTRLRADPPPTPSERMHCPTARALQPRARGSAVVAVAPAPPSARRALRATEPRSRLSSRSRRPRAGPAAGRTRNRSRPGGPREGFVPVVRARVASAEDVAAERTPSWRRGSPTRSW